MASSWYGSRRLGVLGAGMMLLASTLMLSGCSTPIADMPSTANPADAQAQAGSSYPPVNELPPERDTAIISPEERAKIEKELLAARDRQASTVTKDAGK